MTAIRLTMAGLLASLIFIVHCGDGPPTGPGDGPDDTHFPSAIGMLWKYQVYDSLTQTTDTVWFSITDTVTWGAGEFVIERRERRLVAESFGRRYLHFRGDTLEFCDDSIAAPADERIVFPLKLGSTWAGPVSADDTSIVTLVGRIEIPGTGPRRGARIDRCWDRDFEGGGNWSRTWIVPDVGVVSRYHRSQFSDGANMVVTTNETWELIEYDLTTFGLSQFPNKVGTAWIYEEIDSVLVRGGFEVTFDTVTVTIVDDGVLESGDSYALWEIEHPQQYGIDTLYVVTGEERMSLQRDSVFSILWDLYYEFPLAVGRYWGIESFAPVPEVLDKEPVATSFQFFASAFHSQMYGGGFNDYWHQEDWLVPEVGIVRSRRLQFGFIPWMNRTWSLIDFHSTR